jgi:hypothetical protein
MRVDPSRVANTSTTSLSPSTTPGRASAGCGVTRKLMNGRRTISSADVNGCTAQNPPEPAKNSGTHTCTSYQGCSEGHPLRWCAHGGDHNPTEKDSGQSKSWVPGEAWTFISQF